MHALHMEREVYRSSFALVEGGGQEKQEMAADEREAVWLVEGDGRDEETVTEERRLCC